MDLKKSEGASRKSKHERRKKFKGKKEEPYIQVDLNPVTGCYITHDIEVCGPVLNRQFNFDLPDSRRFLHSFDEGHTSYSFDHHYHHTDEYLDAPIWLRGFNSIIIRPFFRDCLTRLEARNWRPHSILELPKQALLEAETIGSCEVIHFWTPSHFHIYFMEKIPEVDLCLQNQIWLRFFEEWESKRGIKKRNPKIHTFRSPRELFTGLKYILGEYLKFLKDHKWEQNWEPKKGDLVIVQVPRSVMDPDGFSETLYPFRGVVLQSVKVIPTECNGVKNCFIVYLLDTGETRVVDFEFLFVLPEAFTSFPPMAIKCALHGVSSIGPEWSSVERLKTLDVLDKSDETKDIKKHVEFKSSYQGPKNIPPDISEIEKRIFELTKSQPYFVEMYIKKLGKHSENLSSILASLKLSLEWSLISQRHFLVKPSAKIDDDAIKKEKKPAHPLTCFSRRDAIIFADHHPPKIKILPREALLREIRSLFESHERLYDQVVFDRGYDNILALKVYDPTSELRTPSIPSVFQQPSKEEKQNIVGTKSVLLSKKN